MLNVPFIEMMADIIDGFMSANLLFERSRVVKASWCGTFISHALDLKCLRLYLYPQFYNREPLNLFIVLESTLAKLANISKLVKDPGGKVTL